MVINRWFASLSRVAVVHIGASFSIYVARVKGGFARKNHQWFLVGVCGVFLLLGIAILIDSVQEVRKGRQSLEWATKRRRIKKPKRFEYRYTVGSKAYTGT